MAGEVRFNLSVTRRTIPRVVEFRHRAHEGVECRQCHTGGLALSATDAECSGCHQEHHRVSASCRTCHAEVGPPFHSNEVHQGCQGAGCHLEESPFRLLDWSRETCLTCHGAQEDHYRDTPECTHCHVMPRPFGEERGGL